VKTKATHGEYHNKMRTHTNCTMHTLSLDKMLGEKKVKLNKREWDLTLWEASLT
jgi:hypothetical protein